MSAPSIQGDESRKKKIMSLMSSLAGRQRVSSENLPPSFVVWQDQLLFFDPPFIVKVESLKSNVASTLPYELMDLILHNLVWDAVKSFSLVCKRWARISRSHAWLSELVLKLNAPDRFTCLIARSCTLSPSSFVLQCTNPDHSETFPYLNPNSIAHRLPNVRRLSVRENMSPSVISAVEAFRNTITTLSFDIKFFPSIHDFIQTISAFSLLEVLRIACSHKVMCHFDPEISLPDQWPSIPGRLRELSFHANTHTLVQPFEKWFTRSPTPAPIVRLTFYDAKTLPALAHFWRLFFCFSNTIEYMSISLADAIHIERSEFDAGMYSATTTFLESTGAQLGHLREIEIKEHPSKLPREAFRMVEAAREKGLSALLVSTLKLLSAPHLRKVAISLLQVTDAMKWTSFDNTLASKFHGRRCVHISTEEKRFDLDDLLSKYLGTPSESAAQRRYELEMYWRSKLQKSSSKGLLSFVGEVDLVDEDGQE